MLELFEPDPSVAQAVCRYLPEGCDYSICTVEREDRSKPCGYSYGYALAIRTRSFTFIGEGGNVMVLARRAHQLWTETVGVASAPY